MNEGQPRLKCEPIWFDDAKRQAISKAFEQVVNEIGYTVWACAVLRNHAHLCVRVHRDDAETIWKRFAYKSREVIRSFGDVPNGHPIWSLRPYARFLHTPEEVWSVVKYIERNPIKEGLARQIWPIVQEYDNWPFHKRHT